VELANQLGQHQKPIGVGQQQQRDRREKQSRSREFHKKKEDSHRDILSQLSQIE
jgi:hypothetical protein